MTERSADTTSPRRPLPPPPAGPPWRRQGGAERPTLAERIQAKLTPDARGATATTATKAQRQRRGQEAGEAAGPEAGAQAGARAGHGCG